MAQNYKFNFVLPSAPKHSDPETNNELLVIYNSIRLLADAVERRNKTYIQAFEDLPLGSMVSMYNNAGVPTVRLAKHAVYECHGFTSVAANAGNIAEVTFFGLFDENPTGQPAGVKLWLSATPGIATSVNPGAGSQRVAITLSTTQSWFNPMLI